MYQRLANFSFQVEFEMPEGDCGSVCVYSSPEVRFFTLMFVMLVRFDDLSVYCWYSCFHGFGLSSSSLRESSLTSTVSRMRRSPLSSTRTL